MKILTDSFIQTKYSTSKLASAIFKFKSTASNSSVKIKFSLKQDQYPTRVFEDMLQTIKVKDKLFKLNEIKFLSKNIKNINADDLTLNTSIPNSRYDSCIVNLNKNVKLHSSLINKDYNSQFLSKFSNDASDDSTHLHLSDNETKINNRSSILRSSRKESNDDIYNVTLNEYKGSASHPTISQLSVFNNIKVGYKGMSDLDILYTNIKTGKLDNSIDIPYNNLYLGHGDINVQHFNGIFNLTTNRTKEIFQHEKIKSLNISSNYLFTNIDNKQFYKGGNTSNLIDNYKQFIKNNNYSSINKSLISINKDQVEARHHHDLFKRFDFNKKYVGIFNNKFMKKDKFHIDLKNSYIFGFNDGKDIDTDKWKLLNIMKPNKESSTYENLQLSVNSNSIFIPETQKEVYVEDFVPPIKILENAVDELLLPQNNFDYSDLRNKVFGPNLSINKDYLKGYSEDGNPIVNVPIGNPIKYYTDIAKNYIDIDVNIMRKVLELLYNNWRENISRFAGASAEKSINYILEKTHNDLKEWYTSVTNVNRIRHAERSLKLFSWFAEMGILAHSDKEIIYEKNNGVFGFWGELPKYNLMSNTPVQEIGQSEILKFNEFHYSQANPYIITSSPGKTALMIIDHMTNSVDTILKLNAYIIGNGCVTVITGGEMFEFRDKTNLIELPLSSIDNSFTIKFLTGDPDSYVDIANFVIVGRYNKGFKVNYSGAVSNVNFTIQHILDFMSITGDSIEDVQPALKSTAQLAYALDTFREYMITHHDNLYKGKRLTIRK